MFDEMKRDVLPKRMIPAACVLTFQGHWTFLFLFQWFYFELQQRSAVQPMTGIEGFKYRPVTVIRPIKRGPA